MSLSSHRPEAGFQRRSKSLGTRRRSALVLDAGLARVRGTAHRRFELIAATL